MLVAFTFMIVIYWVFRRAAPAGTSSLFRRLQMLSAGFMALSHGSNDAQKTMGVITMSLVAAGYLVAPESGKMAVPMWVVSASAVAMGLGTAAGGVRIIKTLGTKIIDLKPMHGFAAETAAATVIFTASHYGLPVSTTHCISGSILGVGASQRVSAVRWGITTRILWAWVLTIPISALSAFLMYPLVSVTARALTGLSLPPTRLSDRAEEYQNSKFNRLHASKHPRIDYLLEPGYSMAICLHPPANRWTA
jgi:PiT family inorganic phosphate transporter